MASSYTEFHCHYVLISDGVQVEQWAKHPPLKQDVPGSNPRDWFNSRAGNCEPLLDGNGVGAVYPSD